MQSRSAPPSNVYDVVVIGAGFYGCALAAHFAATGSKVLVCEAGETSMSRASAVNQARVHTGFHYPRSYATSLRSLHNHGRFAEDFGDAVVRDFRMLYAIARYGTKVNARRFAGMYEAMGAPIETASRSQRSHFSSDLIEEVFSCTEYAFDHTVLRRMLSDRLHRLPVDFSFSTKVDRVARSGDVLKAILAGGREIEAERVFNVTYAQINSLLSASGLDRLPLKHEFVEIALIDPPPALHGLAVTVMDGAFFSSMPYPSEKAYSLTHVRHTPHFSWIDDGAPYDAYGMGDRFPRKTRWKHMLNDSERYMPALKGSVWRKSLFDVKTVPVKNESDDGRPILFRSHPELPGFHSVLGSKIDNIYDLFDAIGPT